MIELHRTARQFAARRHHARVNQSDGGGTKGFTDVEGEHLPAAGSALGGRHRDPRRRAGERLIGAQLPARIDIGRILHASIDVVRVGVGLPAITELELEIESGTEADAVSCLSPSNSPHSKCTGCSPATWR